MFSARPATRSPATFHTQLWELTLPISLNFFLAYELANFDPVAYFHEH